MKTLIQIVAGILVVIASARAGEVAWRYYQFKDAVEQEVRFGNATRTSQLHGRVLELAVEHEVDVAAENVTVESQEGHTVVSVSYDEPIALVPAVYTRIQHFDFEISVRVVRPLIVDP